MLGEEPGAAEGEDRLHAGPLRELAADLLERLREVGGGGDLHLTLGAAPAAGGGEEDGQEHEQGTDGARHRPILASAAPGRCYSSVTASAHATPVRIATVSKRLLLVEDEPDVARLLVYNLEAAGWTVTHAARGLDALARARVDDPVVVILDVMLPDMSGFDVCKRLREAPESADVGIMMLTARGDPDDRITGLEVGADDYVVKPFVVREVILRVAALASRIAERK
ncbi:MAG: response regulator, partial [Kofleriaceae bacterium]